MREILIGLLLEILEKLVTPDLVKVAKEKAVAYLRELAKQSDNELDDKLVDIVAKALGV